VAEHEGRSAMTDGLDQQRSKELQIIEVLIDEHARVACNLVQIGQTWAIHGLLAVDGDEIMAEFTHKEGAEYAMRRISAAEAASTVSVQCIGFEVTNRRSP
jgi:hypothetical protein